MQAVKTAPETLSDNIETLKNLLLSERELSDHYLEEKDAQITQLKQQYQQWVKPLPIACGSGQNLYATQKTVI
jgi:hypothetical protein